MSKRSRRRVRQGLPPASPVAPAQPIRLTAHQLDMMIAAARAGRPQAQPRKDPFAPAVHPPMATPKTSGMAMDDAFGGSSWGGFGSDYGVGAGAYGEGFGFLGFQYLAELMQRPEYRRICETIGSEMTRRWIKLHAFGDEDKSEKIGQINAEFGRLKVREVFREAAEQDGGFGRSHAYLDMGDVGPQELTTSIGDGSDDASRAKVGKGALRRLKNVEAMWTYPMGYNTTDPLSPNWYEPQTWHVMGRPVHATRLLTFVGRAMPDILKPAYSFGGLSLNQMVRPYVENWIETRQSVSDLIRSFSVNGIKLDLAPAADPTGSNLERRIALFTELRDNRGTMVLNTGEEFFNVSTPLGTLDKLQAQAQEHICATAGIPLVKYTGITPSGLNASSEGEIRVWYDWVHAYQETLFRPNLTKVLNFVQLSLFGEIDPDIGFEFEHLWSMDEAERATVRKTMADTDEVLVRTKSITRDEARARVANDPDTPYPGLDLTKPVPSPDDERIDNGTKQAAAKIAAHEAGLTSEATALQGLADTGLFPEITSEIIAEADAGPPTPSELGGEGDDPVSDPLSVVEGEGRLSLGDGEEKDEA